MSKALKGLPEIGDVVYQHYAPTKPGKVIEIWVHPSEMVDTREGWYHWHIRRQYDVVMADGTVEKWAGNTVGGNLQTLIEDHEKKIDTHRKRLDKLKDVQVSS